MKQTWNRLQIIQTVLLLVGTVILISSFKKGRGLIETPGNALFIFSSTWNLLDLPVQSIRTLHYIFMPVLLSSFILVDQSSADKQEETWTLSGKLSCLYQLLRTVYTNTSTVSRDRVVLVSNFTKTLDIIQVYIARVRRYRHLMYRRLCWFVTVLRNCAGNELKTSLHGIS